MRSHLIRVIGAGIISAAFGLSSSAESLAEPSGSLDHERQVSDLIVETAHRLCGILKKDGWIRKTEAHAEVNASFNWFTKKLAELGLNGGAQIDENRFDNIAQGDLPEALRNESGCNQHIFDKLQYLYAGLHSMPVCRHPSHGVERYQREFDVTRTSNWMGGGYDPTRWCNDVVAMVRGEQPAGSIVEAGGRHEDQQNTCNPFNCPQYRYTCTVHVKADPLYKEQASRACPGS